MRLTDSFHQSIWPGERGFYAMSRIRTNVPWGKVEVVGEPHIVPAPPVSPNSVRGRFG